jgi:hypothetical protein
MGRGAVEEEKQISPLRDGEETVRAFGRNDGFEVGKIGPSTVSVDVTVFG